MIARKRTEIDGPEGSPLYEIALMEIVGVTPERLTDETPIKFEHVRELMILAWIRGASWQKDQCIAAGHREGAE